MTLYARFAFTIALLQFIFIISTAKAQAKNCDLIYDEFDHLMNKQFLLNPAQYVTSKLVKLSRHEYNTKQKGTFLLSAHRKGLGIAIVHTNSNTRGKLLFTWGKPYKNGQPSLIIKELVLYGRVIDRFKPRVKRNITIASSFTLDLDSDNINNGAKVGKKADIWFHNIDGKTMYIEAINGAKLVFPMSSICSSNNKKLQTKPNIKAVIKPQLVTATPVTQTNPKNPKKVIKRELLENGHVLIIFSDGSKEERYQGGATRIAADGTRTKLAFSTAAPAAIPVEPPHPGQQDWLLQHKQSLLYIIQGMVENDSLVDSYLSQLEGTSDLYKDIDTRSKIIQQLVQP